MPSQLAPSKSAVLVLFALLALALFLPARGVAAPVEIEVLSITPSPALLPLTTVGEQSQSTDFKLTNTSGGNVFVMGASISGAASNSFVYNGGNCQTTLAPGEECSVGISFKPEAAGTVQAALEVSFMGGEVQKLPIEGRGVEPEIAFVPAVEDFGLVALREHGNDSLQLVNEGEAPTRISGSTIEGPDSQRFFYEFNGCQGQTLNPGNSCSVQVNFEPQDRVDYEATLHAFAGSATATAILKGRGGGAVVEPTSAPPGFGPATVGSAGIVRTVTIGNSGDLPAGFFIAILAGGDSGSFQLISENCTGHPLLPAATCSAQVRFRPLSAGPKTATLAFFGEGEGGGLLPIDGVGVDALASLSSGGLGFGPAVAGTRSAPLRIAVRNGGAEPIATGQISIVGADLDQFALVGDECSGETIAPGGECALRVRFAPDSAGAKNARLLIGVPGGNLTATLAGTATAAPSKAKSKKAKKNKHHHHGNHRHQANQGGHSQGHRTR